MHEAMGTVKAHVRNGHFVSDEPANLPEGTPVELQLVTTDALVDIDPEQRVELHQAIREGFEDARAGRTIPAEQWLAELRSRL
jgi:predicted transcriptional regulator